MTSERLGKMFEGDSTEMILVGPILTKGLWGIKSWSISGHLKKTLEVISEVSEP